MSGCHDAFWNDAPAVREPLLHIEQAPVTALAGYNANLRRIQVNVLPWCRHDCGIDAKETAERKWTPRPEQRSLQWWCDRFGGAVDAKEEMRKRWGEEFSLRVSVGPDGMTTFRHL